MLEIIFDVAPETAAVTVICRVAVTELPALSEAVIVRLCMPKSREAGIHEKLPDALIFDFEMLVLVKASETENIGFENPNAKAENVSAVPAGIVASGTGAVRIRVAGAD